MRQPLGISIVGGLLVSQILTLYTTPVVYLYLDRFRVWISRPQRTAAPYVSDATAVHMTHNDAHWPRAIRAAAAPRCKVGPNYRRPDAPVASAYKEDQAWKPAVPAQIPADEHLVEHLQRPGARLARASGGGVEPEPEGCRGRVSRGRGADRHRSRDRCCRPSPSMGSTRAAAAAAALRRASRPAGGTTVTSSSSRATASTVPARRPAGSSTSGDGSGARSNPTWPRPRSAPPISLPPDCRRK